MYVYITLSLSNESISFKRDLGFAYPKIPITFPMQEFVTATVTNKGKKGNWDWWFEGVQFLEKSKSLMYANNIIYILTLQIEDLVWK
tara:strand:+ start:3379 stop:3639 length:261 start_codon:yes stop_codon:yes gene_type:complete